jgi:hypothetical protein
LTGPQPIDLRKSGSHAGDDATQTNSAHMMTHPHQGSFASSPQCLI